MFVSRQKCFFPDGLYAVIESMVSRIFNSKTKKYKKKNNISQKNVINTRYTHVNLETGKHTNLNTKSEHFFNKMVYLSKNVRNYNNK
jgi:hypothetical protein